MPTKSQFISTYIPCVALFAACSMVWLWWKYREFINTRTVLEAMKTGKRELDPDIAKKWDRDSTRVNRLNLFLMFLGVLIFLVLPK